MFDIHCHILYDVDDGSESLEESEAMLVEAKKSGIDRIVCTPHCRRNWFNPKRFQSHFKVLSQVAAEHGIDMDLGCEVNWKKLYEIGLDWAPKLTLGDTSLFLLEFSDEELPNNWQNLVFKLQGMGLDIIIAHPERYVPVQRDIDIAYELKEMGCYLQLSANFIEEGRFGVRRRAATAMLKEGLIDYVASDAHCPEDYALYRQALEYAQKF
ncbi:MAG: hypothetical protein Q4E12_02440 [Coriobacteriia bacterium]|nr:hypothetical protein [Coriobacteriia bacterium]